LNCVPSIVRYLT